MKKRNTNLLKEAQKGDRIEEIYSALKLVEIAREYNGTEAKTACEKVLELIKEDGTTKSSKRGTVGSFCCIILFW